MTKDELFDALEDSREMFLDLIDQCEPDELQEQGVNGEWSIKDILAHLSAWEAEMVKMLWQTRQGLKPSSAHFLGVSVDELNQRWYQSFKNRPIELIFADYEAVRKQTVRRVQEFSEKELNDPGYFPSLKGEPLWEWIANDSFGHEEEHAPAIREWIARKHD